MSRYRYGAYRGGPDPLAPPTDVGGAVDDLADRVLEGRSVREALRDLMQSGTESLRGWPNYAVASSSADGSCSPAAGSVERWTRCANCSTRQ